MHSLVLPLALLALICLPCFVALVICADDLLDRAAWSLAERRARWRARRDSRRQRRVLDRLDRALLPPQTAPPAQDEDARHPAIEAHRR